jgi:hypothetical protein
MYAEFAKGAGSTELQKASAEANEKKLAASGDPNAVMRTHVGNIATELTGVKSMIQAIATKSVWNPPLSRRP